MIQVPNKPNNESKNDGCHQTRRLPLVQSAHVLDDNQLRLVRGGAARSSGVLSGDGSVIFIRDSI